MSTYQSRRNQVSEVGSSIRPWTASESKAVTTFVRLLVMVQLGDGEKSALPTDLYRKLADSRWQPYEDWRADGFDPFNNCTHIEVDGEEYACRLPATQETLRLANANLNYLNERLDAPAPQSESRSSTTLIWLMVFLQILIGIIVVVSLLHR